MNFFYRNTIFFYNEHKNQEKKENCQELQKQFDLKFLEDVIFA